MEIIHRLLEFSNGTKYDVLKRELDKLGALYTIEILGTKSIFSSEGITGLDYSHPMRHTSSTPIESVYQLRIDVNPNFGLVTDGLIAENCRESDSPYLRQYPADYPYCGRSKFNYPRRDAIRFQRASLQGMPDKVKSQEYFGSGWGGS